jgi:hypothetical protein
MNFVLYTLRNAVPGSLVTNDAFSAVKSEGSRNHSI